MESISQRKKDHIQICLTQNVQSAGNTTGLEAYRFIPEALPEIDFESIHTETRFLHKPLKVPFIVSSMTGGTTEALQINRTLASAAEARGWGFGIGSVRAALENPEVRSSFIVRDVAPTVPIFTNLGAVQLNYGYGVEQCRAALELLQADGIVLHLNSMQEIFQPEGDTNFSGLLEKIRVLCTQLEAPVGIKEVGFGIHGELAAKLYEAGVAFVDVAGAGGTSWIEVEKHRAKDPQLQLAADTFAEWGLPTADCIVQARACSPNGFLIASGGIHNGLHAAKTLALGADLCGFGRRLLEPAIEGEAALDKLMARLEFELKAAMFGIGCKSLAELKGTSKLVRTAPPPARA
ncbi:type 2 isopentenyl-diphosphate Delta-isomerase [Marinicrinis lubricantis]|uniref:Isopentenyl-diphosphate delta-isomerase n=1 Tax=Marinicrinis lubricantis TaxID=2086470 RepID=A0ABW1IVZ5_9BACL